MSTIDLDSYSKDLLNQLYKDGEKAGENLQTTFSASYIADCAKEAVEYSINVIRRIAAHQKWQMKKSEIIVNVVNWWKNDVSVNMSFSENAAESLLRRANSLKENSIRGIVSVDI